jgi:hypothetical protein
MALTVVGLAMIAIPRIRSGLQHLFKREEPPIVIKVRRVPIEKTVKTIDKTFRNRLSPKFEGLKVNTKAELPPVNLFTIPIPTLLHGRNTCFLATLMWTAFFNEPKLQQEVALAAERHTDPNKKLAMQQLLEFIDRNNSANTPVAAREMENLRTILHLCDPQYDPNGVDQLDISEVYLTLADVIYHNSPNRSFLNSVNILHPNGYRLKKEEGRDPDLGTVFGQAVDIVGGAINLPFERSKRSLRELIDHAFFPQVTFSANYTVEGANDRKSFSAQQVFTIDAPPPLIAFTVGRFNDHTAKINDPIHINDIEVFEGRYFKNVEDGAAYELSSVAVHTGDLHRGHYTALVKKGMDWYFCDDLSGIYPMSKEEALQYAQHGYMFFYKRIG